MADERWTRLGAVIRAARVRRWRTLADFASSSGVSVRTLSDLEGGRRDRYEAGTLAAVEATLGWKPGSISTVLGGGDPAPETDEALARLLAAWPTLSDDARELLAELAEKVTRRQ